MTLQEINESQKKTKRRLIVIGVLFLIGGVVLFFSDEALLGLVCGCIGVLGLLLATIFKPISEEAFNKMQEREAAQAVANSNISQEDKKKLRFAEMAYKHGDITLMQYEAYKSKILGTEFIGKKIGMTPDQILAEQAKEVKDIKIEQAQKQAEKTVAMHTIVGGELGGIAGAVAGAAIGMQKAENDLKNAEDNL